MRASSWRDAEGQLLSSTYYQSWIQGHSWIQVVYRLFSVGPQASRWTLKTPNMSFLLQANLGGPAVSLYYSAGQIETFIWATLSLQRHFIHLTEERVSAVCNSPFKGHQPAFVKRFDEPLFPSLEKPALALSQTEESRKKVMRKVNCFQVPCSFAVLIQSQAERSGGVSA